MEQSEAEPQIPKTSGNFREELIKKILITTRKLKTLYEALADVTNTEVIQSILIEDEDDDDATTSPITESTDLSTTYDEKANLIMTNQFLAKAIVKAHEDMKNLTLEQQALKREEHQVLMELTNKIKSLENRIKELMKARESTLEIPEAWIEEKIQQFMESEMNEE